MTSVSRLKFHALALTAFVSLAACGVDTTGLSPESSRTFKGPSTASVTVTEYGDLQCPACASAYTLLNKPLEEKYGSRVKFEFRHFPLRDIHGYAFEAAQASECAADQGKFWEFLELNYLQQSDLNSDELRAWAGQLGLDVPLFDRCVRSGIKGDTVAADFAAGKKIGVDHTPMFFVDGQAVAQNNLTMISDAIDAALMKKQSVPL